jgi:TolB-like protein/cytochrome c-type biogenesis protein CcmH/NrfG
MTLFKELKRRNVFKVATVYIVTSWLLMQVGSVVLPAFEAPSWVMKTFLVLLSFGFIIALILAWAFEITPEGVKREADIAPEDSVTAHTGRKLDFFIIGLLTIALAYFIFESRFVSSPTETVVAKSTATIDSPQDVTLEPEGSSIAVLPFVNMSSDKEQEYFSDGISEEILNVLAKIPKLQVTSRSSAFFFKGKEIIISDVAKKLGVKHILEGSVRKSGNRIRITAQLIEAETDKHLWSETYDRELTDIFAIQDEISAAIVMALKAKLGLNVKVATRDMSAVNLDAHNEYLQGRFYIEKRNQIDLENALAHFDKAIELAPEYAPAWMGKAWAINYLSEGSYGNVPRAISVAEARPAIERALQLAPDLPEAHAILGLIESEDLNPDKAIVHYQKAIELNPNYADAYTWYGNMLFDQPKKRLELFQKAIQLSPMSILANFNYGLDLIAYGRIDEAREVAEHMLSINELHHFPFSMLGTIHLVEGEYALAIIAYETAIKFSPENVGARFAAAIPLATIGFGDKAASYIDGTIADAHKYRFKGNVELYISQMRETFPRNENDSVGYWARGAAEVYAENYQDASQFFKLTEMDATANDRIYSFQQTGDIDKARTLLRKAKSQLTLWIDASAKYIYSLQVLQPIELWVMEIAYLEGDIDKAIAALQQAMEQNYIVNFEYQVNPIYKKLRAHPDWPAIIAESNKRASVQRELYLKLIAEGGKTSF